MNADVNKPRVALRNGQFQVTYRNLTGTVFHDERSDKWYASRNVGGDRLSQSIRPTWTSREAFDALVADMDLVADCRDLAVQVDALESKGLRGRLAQLGGESAVAVFDAALVKIQRDDADGLPVVRGMVKAATARKLAQAQTIITSAAHSSRTYGLTIVPGFSVAFTGGPTYYIGQAAEYNSYNLHYFGEIESITTSTVTIRKGQREKSRRLKMAAFAWRNAAEPASKAERNHDVMMHC